MALEDSTTWIKRSMQSVPGRGTWISETSSPAGTWTPITTWSPAHKMVPKLPLNAAAAGAESARDVLPASLPLDASSPSEKPASSPSSGQGDPLRFVAQTPNIQLLEGGLLTVREWSGGALLEPPDEHRFQLSVKFVDAVAESPIFVGIAPADADLAVPNLFGCPESGVLLCIGGSPPKEAISALGAPSGPALHAFGKRVHSNLRTPVVGDVLKVTYWEEAAEDAYPPIGHVCFAMMDKRGRKVMNWGKPDLGRLLRSGAWRPCILLCVPDSRLQVQQLI